tara:strand:+ start:542 stop:1300 length:759 start_codon:yes stop_codon:yes gene_type:complete
MLEELLKLNIFAFLLVLARVGAMMSILPGIAAAYVSPRIRVLLAIAVAVVMTPVLAANLPGPPEHAWILFLLLAGEIIVGVFLGGIAVILVSALQTAGTMIALFSAMANALIQDAVSEQQSSVIANLLTMAGLVIIFVTDSHHIYFKVLADSYNLFTPGAGASTGDMALILARRVADSFTMGFQLSIPFLIIAMVYYIGLGVLGRLMPQLPVFFFGLPIQLTVQIGALMIVFSTIMMVFLNYFRQGYGIFTG